jgi:hypothetical protein
METTTNDLLVRLKRDVRVEVIDDLIRHLNTLKASASVPEGPSLEGMNLIDAARAIIKEQGPRGTRELAQTMLARGIRTNSKNFVATVYATLKVADDFVRSGGNWELKKKR